jgi:hypothetical protein
MADFTLLSGTYSADINGSTRILTMGVGPNGIIAGSWTSTILGIGTVFPVSGHVVHSTFNNDAVYFHVAGFGIAYDQSKQPPILHSANAIVGFANVQSTNPPQTLSVSISWAEDNVGYGELTDAWGAQVLNRH